MTAPVHGGSKLVLRGTNLPYHGAARARARRSLWRRRRLYNTARARAQRTFFERLWNPPAVTYAASVWGEAGTAGHKNARAPRVIAAGSDVRRLTTYYWGTSESSTIRSASVFSCTGILSHMDECAAAAAPRAVLLQRPLATSRARTLRTQAPHASSVELLQKRYPEYTDVSWSDEGY